MGTTIADFASLALMLMTVGTRSPEHDHWMAMRILALEAVGVEP
jgi:hypothetical protein